MRTIPLLALLALGSAAPVAAEFIPAATAVPDSVPGGMNYQGRLEKDGFPVTGTRAMVFRLYNAATGGTALYNSGTLSVAVSQGAFSVSLDIPFGSLTGTAQKYLELEVEGVVLSPRDPLRSVPYAKVAETVEGSVEISTAGLTFTTNNIDSLSISSASGRVGVGTAAPLSRLHVSSGTGETGLILLVSTGASTLASVDGNGVLTAHHLAASFGILKTTLTVQGGSFSVGSPTFVVDSGRVGLGVAAPLATLSVVGDSSFSQPATFASSVTVGGAANFGAAATKTTVATTGAVAIPGTASLAVGSTFFVDGANGRVGVGTASPSVSAKLQVLGGDVLIGNPAVHDVSANPDLLVEGNFVLDGKFLQHTGSFSAFDQLGVSGEPQAGQTFAVGYTSFNVTNAGLVGIGTVSPGAKLTLVGDQSVSQSATFASSITVLGPNRLLGGFMDPATFNSSLTVVGPNRLIGGYQLPATFYSSVTVRQAASFGNTGQSVFDTAGALSVASGQNITVAGNAELLGLPATPSGATAATSKNYVDNQFAVGGLSPWTRDTGNGEVELNTIGDKVGIGTASPLAKLHVVGDLSVTTFATFGNSVTVRNAASFGTTGQSSFNSTGVLTLGTQLAIASGGTGGTSQATAQSALNVPSVTGSGASGNWGINITGNAATVTTNANLTGNVTSVGNATTIAVIPAVSGAALTNLTAANISAGTAGINISGNAATVTTNANLTGNVTSVGNATTIAVIPAVSGAALTNLTAANISAGTAGINISGNAATATAVAATGVTAGTLATTVVAQTVSLVSANIATLMGTAAGAAGKLYYCSNCTGGVGGAGAVVVSTGTGLAGQFAIADGGPFQ